MCDVCVVCVWCVVCDVCVVCGVRCVMCVWCVCGVRCVVCDAALLGRVVSNFIIQALLGKPLTVSGWLFRYCKHTYHATCRCTLRETKQDPSCMSGRYSANHTSFPLCVQKPDWLCSPPPPPAHTHTQ